MAGSSQNVYAPINVNPEGRGGGGSGMRWGF